MEVFTQGSNAAPMSKEVTQYVGFLDFLSSQKISVVYKILRFIKQAFSLVGIEVCGNEYPFKRLEYKKIYITF